MDFHKEHDCTIYEGKSLYGSTLDMPKGINTMNKCAKICTELEECDGFIFAGTLCFLKRNSRLTDSNGWQAGICPKGEVQSIVSKIWSCDDFYKSISEKVENGPVSKEENDEDDNQDDGKEDQVGHEDNKDATDKEEDENRVGPESPVTEGRY